MPPRRSNANLIAEQVAAQLNTAIPNMIAQITAGINQHGNQGNNNNINQEIPQPNQKNRQGCSYKNFMACKPKEFHGTTGAVGLLSWIESIESVLHISRCAEAEKVEYATCVCNTPKNTVLFVCGSIFF